MPNTNWITWIFILIAIVAAFLFGIDIEEVQNKFKHLWPGLTARDKIVTVGADLTGSLFVIAVFLERSLAVVNGIIFKKAEETNLNKPTKQESLNAQKKTDIEKSQIRLALGFLIAVLVSAAGPRTLEALFKSPPLEPSQLQLFTTADILITAGLLAGGSSAIAQIIELLKQNVQDAIQRTRAEIYERRNPPS